MTNPTIENLERARARAAAVRQSTPEEERKIAWSRYHHGLQAAYEAGELIARPKFDATNMPTTTINYTNWRGVRSTRTIIPVGVWYGSTRWHAEDQYFLAAMDVEKGEMRDFALRDIQPV